MLTFTTDNELSLQEQRINAVLKLIDQWRHDCICAGKSGQFCESFGCDSLEEIAKILRGEISKALGE